jgi:hypothetical protein
MKKTSDYVLLYKEQLEKGDVPFAYELLIKYVMSVKAHCEKTFSTSIPLAMFHPDIWISPTFPFIMKI